MPFITTQGKKQATRKGWSKNPEVTGYNVQKSNEMLHYVKTLLLHDLSTKLKGHLAYCRTNGPLNRCGT